MSENTTLKSKEEKILELKSRSLYDERVRMRPLLKTGTTCACCDQRVQMYIRSLTSSMVYGLILLYNHYKACGEPENYYIHLEDFFKKQENLPSSVRGDVPKLRFWGFISPDGQDAEDGNPSTGRYKIMQKGIDFVNGKILVQKSARLYNNKFYGFEGPETDVFACIKNKFNYSELMGKENIKA